MKNILNIVLFLLIIAAASSSQTESIIYLKETDFKLYKTHKVKYQETGEIKMERQVISLENAEMLIFLNNDSIALAVETGTPVFTRLADIHEVSKYEKRLSPVLGITLGAIGGGILGLVIGGTVYQYEPKSDGNIFDPLGEAASRNAGAIVGALIGAVGGAVMGAVITNAINYVSLELFSIPDKKKKTKLIKFLKQK